MQSFRSAGSETGDTMFLHLGSGVSVRTKDVIAIHDYTLFAAGDGIDYFGRLKEKKKIVDVTGGEDEPKSLVLTADLAYLSILSATTLANRTRLAWDKG